MGCVKKFCERRTNVLKMSDGGISDVNNARVVSMHDIRESLAVAERLASAAMMTSPAARRRLAARRCELPTCGYVPPKQLLLYLVRYVDTSHNTLQSSATVVVVIV